MKKVSVFDRQAAMHLDRAFDLHDPLSHFVDVVTFFGLSADNVTDPLTAVLAVAWVTANRADDPSVAQVQALRLQCRHAVSRMTRLTKSSDMEKQELAEAFIDQFLIVFNLLMAARSRGHIGSFEEVSKEIALVAQRFVGCDLRSLCFGRQGFRRAW